MAEATTAQIVAENPDGSARKSVVTHIPIADAKKKFKAILEGKEPWPYPDDRSVMVMIDNNSVERRHDLAAKKKPISP